MMIAIIQCRRERFIGSKQIELPRGVVGFQLAEDRFGAINNAAKQTLAVRVKGHSSFRARIMVEPPPLIPFTRRAEIQRTTNF
mgnify:CR=1 FL=1